LAFKGIDIRTVGSGNVGATNAGRVLGFKYFLLVFVLDLLKGLLPVVWVPWLVVKISARPVPELGVFVALAAILGHNFPVYLKFKGGKGVATSLGAFLALDPTASVAAVVAFVVLLLVTKYVSASSIGGALIFALVHFMLRPQFWGQGELAMSLLTVSLVALLIVRHNKNFARIRAGTEPKVVFRRKQEPPPSGKVVSALVVLLLVAAAGLGLCMWASRPSSLDCGEFVLSSIARTNTGHQRAERVAFADHGRLLAVTCPRYERVVLYRITDRHTLELVRDVRIGGRAVAIWPLHDRFLVLVRPYGDARHVEAGWLQALDFQGRLIGSKFRVGFDPDDLAVSSDERWAFVLNSGHAEGETNRPDPELAVLELSGGSGSPPSFVSRLVFDQPGDDPDRIRLSASGQRAAVSLLGSDQLAAIDLTDPTRPVLSSRMRLPVFDLPYPSFSDHDCVMLPVASEREAVLVTLAGRDGTDGGLKGSYVIGTLPDRSGLEVVNAAHRRTLGSLPLRGTANLGTIRPAGLAYCAERNLIAVANRSGGSVHLVAVKFKEKPGPPLALTGQRRTR
jgi:glycerol-3-phosphate acyltransferase PlsY